MSKSRDPTAVLSAVASVSSKPLDPGCISQCCCNSGYYDYLFSLLDFYKGGVFYLLVDCYIKPNDEIVSKLDETIRKHGVLVSEAWHRCFS